MTDVDKEWMAAASDLCRHGHWSYFIGLLDGSNCISQAMKKKQSRAMRRSLEECQWLAKAIRDNKEITEHEVPNGS